MRLLLYIVMLTVKDLSRNNNVWHQLFVLNWRKNVSKPYCTTRILLIMVLVHTCNMWISVMAVPWGTPQQRGAGIAH